MTSAGFKPPLKLIDKLLKIYADNYEHIRYIMNSILGGVEASKPLKDLVHSVRFRMKDPSHLRQKLIRKAKEAADAGEEFGVTEENLLVRINDLVGIRLLHLHTAQFPEINSNLIKVFEDYKFDLLEGPIARTWDDEYREFFEKAGIKTQKSPNMYTSVHYVVASNSRVTATCEIQVRTLMEEVWGEVDHKLNYPEKTKFPPCGEQIRALARLTSSSTRLVDSIFTTYEYMNAKK